MSLFSLVLFPSSATSTSALCVNVTMSARPTISRRAATNNANQSTPIELISSPLRISRMDHNACLQRPYRREFSSENFSLRYWHFLLFVCYAASIARREISLDRAFDRWLILTFISGRLFEKRYHVIARNVTFYLIEKRRLLGIRASFIRSNLQDNWSDCLEMPPIVLSEVPEFPDGSLSRSRLSQFSRPREISRHARRSFIKVRGSDAPKIAR